MTETAQNLERFRELNREEWTNSSVVDGWRKWYKPFSEFFRPVTEKMVNDGEIQSGMQILDLASGSGDPAITFSRVVGTGGHVTATDFNPEMLAGAEANAKEAAAENLSFRQADAHELPFENETFDRVTCRLGVMYFGDHVQALREMRRVLKPKGKVVLVATGGFEQPFIDNTLGILMKHVEMPPPEPDAPDPFRFSPNGSLSGALESADFRDIQEEHVALDLSWPGSPAELRKWFVDIAPPVQAILERLPEERRGDIYAEMETSLGRFVADDSVNIPVHFVFGGGSK